MNAIHIIFLVACVLLLVLVAINYARSGEVNFTSIVLVCIFLSLIAVQRASLKRKDDGS